MSKQAKVVAGLSQSGAPARLPASLAVARWAYPLQSWQCALFSGERSVVVGCNRGHAQPSRTRVIAAPCPSCLAAPLRRPRRRQEPDRRRPARPCFGGAGAALREAGLGAGAWRHGGCRRDVGARGAPRQCASRPHPAAGPAHQPATGAAGSTSHGLPVGWPPRHGAVCQQCPSLLKHKA